MYFTTSLRGDWLHIEAVFFGYFPIPSDLVSLCSNHFYLPVHLHDLSWVALVCASLCLPGIRMCSVCRSVATWTFENNYFLSAELILLINHLLRLSSHPSDSSGVPVVTPLSGGCLCH